MKRIIVFILAGLFFGLGAGGFIAGSRERDAILEAKAAEEAAVEAQEHDQGSPASTEADGAPAGSGDGEVSQEDHGMVGGTDVREQGAGSPDGEGGGDPGVEEEAGSPGPAPEHDSSSLRQADSQAGEGEISVDPVETPTTAAGIPSRGLSSARSLAAAALEDGLPPEGPQRLAKIFGAMEPRDAAAVLQNLEDGEVRVILLEMSDRKVAEILGEFEPERAATLSRIVLELRAGTAR